MNHSIISYGAGFKLRPVEMKDAEFIVQLRTSEPSRTRYLHKILPDVAHQRKWLTDYFERGGDYYWVIEQKKTSQPEGLIAIYDVDSKSLIAEWGRWILRAGSLAAVESALLVYKVAFEQLNLRAVYCITVAENKQVVSFHDSCGIHRADLLKNKYKLDDELYDGIKHICNKSDYPNLVNKLKPQAEMISSRFSN